MSSRPLLILATIGTLLGCTNAHARYKDRPELTPLMNTAWQNDLPRASKLIQQGADVRQRTKKGETPLYEAIERLDLNDDNLPMVDLLLKSGADPNEIEFEQTPPLLMSLTRDYGNPQVTLLLIKAGAKVPTTCPNEDSVLSLATQDSSLEVMAALIAKGADVNCQNSGSALYWAVLNGQADRVELLLKSGADRNIRNKEGKTPLDIATTTNPEKRVQAEFVKTRELLIRGQ